MGVAQRAWHHHIFGGFLWYPIFTVIFFWSFFDKGKFQCLLFHLSSHVKCIHFHVWRSTVSPPKQRFFAKDCLFAGRYACKIICILRISIYVYFIRYIYIHDDICFHPHIPYTHMNTIICICIHNTDCISPFNTRWCQPRDLVLRFYRRNPKSQEWFRRTAGWDTICVSASFFFFSVAIFYPKRWTPVTYL